jgi:hypothetical protein
MKPTKEQLEACKNKVAKELGFNNIQEAIDNAIGGDQIEWVIDKLLIEIQKS